VWFFRGNSTKREFEQVHQEMAELKRRFLQMEQEWDATSTRVSKVLRRIARAEQAADDRTDAVIEGNGGTLPLTSIATPSDRMAKIRAQLAQKGRS